MIPILGFLPDADPSIPGVLTFCQRLLPTQRGMESAPTQADAIIAQPALADFCRGAKTVYNTLGVSRTFAGTQTKLYELTPPTWTDIGRGAAYTGTTISRWQFAQFGNIALAANYQDVIQASTGASFADVATAPKAKVLFASKDLVIAMNTNDATFGAVPDGWWCSAFQDYTSWTPSLTTSAARGRLIGVTGPITAGLMLGTYAVAYKARGTYVGQVQIGVAGTIQWDQIPGEFGCVGPEAVADIGGAHFVVGPDNFWIFDGTRPTPVGQNEVREWFYTKASTQDLYRTIVHFDQQSARVWVLFASPGANTDAVDSALIYDLRSKRWGICDDQVAAAFQFTAPGITYGNFATLGPTWADLEARGVANDSPLLRPEGRVMAVFNRSKALQSMSGPPSTGYLATGDFGVDGRSSYTDELLIHFATNPSGESFASGFTKDTAGGELTGVDLQPLSDGKYDLRQSGRWHRYSMNFAGTFELVSIDPQLKAEGAR